MPNYTLDWNKYTGFAIQAAEEGSVLIKNDNNVLPAVPGTKVALFGRMQTHYYKSGTGSGGMVNVEHVVDILEGLQNSGLVLDQKVIDTYAEWEKTNPVDPGVGWGKERWSQDEMPLDPDFVSEAAKNNDVAIMIIARTAGEDRDNTAEPGSYYLSSTEEAMLEAVTGAFKKTVVLLNVGNIIDMSFIDKYNPSAIMYIWQSGMIGGTAAANLVTGKAVPSGCLTDTIAYALEDYPSTANFGNVDPMKDIYAEDIYVGYRYFSTFAPEKVRYPFGFGLSYTTFECSDATFENNGTDVKVTVKVTNTGSVAGKKTVMLFASAPQGKLGKPARVLVAYAKTATLAPGESEVLELTAVADRYASYDDADKTGNGTCWILEAGTYNFYLGENVDVATLVGSFDLDGDIVLEKLESACAPVEAFDRLGLGGKYEPVPVRKVENRDIRERFIPAEIPQTGDKGIKLADVIDGKNSMDEFIAQLEDEDLSLMSRGEGMSSPKVTTGTAAAFGGISKELMSYGIPTLCCSDGPSGMRIDSGKKAFSIPNGTCLASTFNEALMTDLFECFGIEMISNGIDSILGPGINIHRNPLNGRNFEYFSEDPFLTGRMAAAQIIGLEKNHVTATIKHFCANNRETNRRFMDSVVSERALREIYLKSFEVAVKDGKARSIMSVYNKINGTYGTANYELNTMVLRQQWGYTGIVMTDWWAFIKKIPATMYHSPEDLNEHSLMASAQCDIYMVCSNVERNAIGESDIMDNLRDNRTDLITRAELQRNAANIIRFAIDTPAMNRVRGDKAVVKHIDNPFKEDSSEATVSKYYKADEEPTIEVDVDTSLGGDFTFGLDSDRPGRYEAILTGSSELNSLAQIPMTVYYTSIPVRVITWNGTEGQDVSIETSIRVISKYTVFRFHFGAPGFKLKTIKLRFLYSPEDDPNKEF